MTLFLRMHIFQSAPQIHKQPMFKCSEVHYKCINKTRSVHVFSFEGLNCSFCIARSNLRQLRMHISMHIFEKFGHWPHTSVGGILWLDFWVDFCIGMFSINGLIHAFYCVIPLYISLWQICNLFICFFISWQKTLYLYM